MLGTSAVDGARPELLSPLELLRHPAGEPIPAMPHLAGFGSLHGGLVLALMTSQMQAGAPERHLHSATARYYRPVDGEFELDITTVRESRTSTMLAGRAAGPTGPYVDASAIFGPIGAARWPEFNPPAPQAPVPQDCEIFQIPPEFVPIARYTEIRPVGPNRPYAGGSEPELTAWIRLVEDDLPPDPHRFVFLMDALAPSYSAVLDTMAMVPTVEFTVRPSTNLLAVSSPWVLVRARTRAASAGGWTSEQIDTWGPDGSYLGSADQLRIVRGPAA